jgi:mRNA interferase MazF
MNIDLQETQNIIDSTKEQIFLQGKTHSDSHATPARGQVFNCHLGVGVGSEFQKRRPCVVLSNAVNNMNNSVIVVAPVTHTQKELPVCVKIADKRNIQGEIILDGCVNLSGLRAVSSYRLAGKICELDAAEMKMVDAALARHLDLMRYYNTLTNINNDKSKHINAINDFLFKLRNITGARDNKELLETVRKLIERQNADPSDC